MSEREQAAVGAKRLAIALFASVLAPNVVMVIAMLTLSTTRDLEKTLHVSRTIASSLGALFSCGALWPAWEFSRAVPRPVAVRAAIIAYALMGVAHVVHAVTKAQWTAFHGIDQLVSLGVLLAIASALRAISARAARAGRMAVGFVVSSMIVDAFFPPEDLRGSIATGAVIALLVLAGWITLLLGLWLASNDLRARSDAAAI